MVKLLSVMSLFAVLLYFTLGTEHQLNRDQTALVWGGNGSGIAIGFPPCPDSTDCSLIRCKYNAKHDPKYYCAPKTVQITQTRVNYPVNNTLKKGNFTFANNQQFYCGFFRACSTPCQTGTIPYYDGDGVKYYPSVCGNQVLGKFPINKNGITYTNNEGD